MELEPSGEGRKVQLPELNLGALVDDPAEMTEYWDSLRDPRNVSLVDGHTWMSDKTF